MSNNRPYTVKSNAIILGVEVTVKLKEYPNGQVYTGAATAADVIRQILKKKYPDIKVWVTSDTFSMGDSIDVNINCAPAEVYKEIEGLCNKFQDGHFDGMTDMYNHNGTGIYVEYAQKSYELGAKYVKCANYPKYGTQEYENYRNSK